MADRTTRPQRLGAECGPLESNRGNHNDMKTDSETGNGAEASGNGGRGRRAHTSRSEVTPFLDAVRSGPDVDAEKVARARQLLEKDGYPSDAVMQAIAKQLARDWPSDPPTSPRRA